MFSVRSRCILALLALSYFSVRLLTAQAQNESPAQNSSPAPTKPNAQTTPSPANKPEPQTPTLIIRETVRRVIVDVMVRDASGKPVHGLKAGDFSITEDKQSQRIQSFDAYDLDKPSISRGPNAPPLPPNVFLNVPAVPERGPLYVMLLDLVNTEFDDQMFARQQILKFIGSKPAGTRFAIFVTSDMLRLVQGFTDDKDLLYAALNPNHPKPGIPKVFLLGRNYGQGDPYTAVDMLTHVGQYLDGIPGRKNLIWVAGTFPVALAAEEANSAYWDSNVKAELNALAQARVAVFPLNVRGVVTNPEGALTGATPNGGAATVAANSPAAIASPMSSPASNPTLLAMQSAGQGGSLTRDYGMQEEIAWRTGGRAFYSSNDLSLALSDATEDGGNYYTLTYSPPSQQDDGKCHNIVVAIAKATYQLAYRRIYCRVPLVSAATEESEEGSGISALVFPTQAGDVLQANMRPGAPMLHDLIFSALVHTEGAAAMATPEQMAQLQEQAAFFRTHRRNKLAKPLPPIKIQQYVIEYRVLDPQLKAQAARSGKQAMLELAVAAFDKEGKVQNGMVNDAELQSNEQSGQNKAGLYVVRQSLVVAVGAVSLRVGVRDRTSDRMGTLEMSLPLVLAAVNRAVAAH